MSAFSDPTKPSMSYQEEQKNMKIKKPVLISIFLWRGALDSEVIDLDNFDRLYRSNYRLCGSMLPNLDEYLSFSTVPNFYHSLSSRLTVEVHILRWEFFFVVY